MSARFPTEMSSIPMFPNAVDTAVRTRPTPAPKSETPTAAPKGDLVSRYQTFMEQPQAELKTAIEDKQKFEFAQEQDVAARTAGKARSRGEALDVERTAIEDSAAMRGLADVDKQMEVPFTPTKDNAMDLATLYSLIGVVGFAIGVGGKGNAQAAMSAMNGMATGYQKGRMDLYAKEKDLFDTNLRQLKTRSETLGRELERITRLAAYDRQKAELEADALFAEQGANFMRDYKAKYGLPKSLELAKQNVEASDKMFQIVIKQEETARNRAEDRAFRLQMAQMQMDARRDIAAMKGGGVGGKPPSEKQVKDVAGLTSLATDLEKLRSEFKPEYASLGLLGFGADLSIEAKRRLSDPEGQKAAAWWARYNLLQAPNRHALYGATLTGNELQNYRSFTTNPGDDPNYVLNNLQEQINYSVGTAQRRADFLRDSGYRIPQIQAPGFLDTYQSGGSLPTPSAGGVDVATERRNANAAIQQGADPAKVKERFKKNTGQEL